MPQTPFDVVKKILLLWLLPVVDLVCLRKILAYYASVGVHVPRRHAKVATLERLLGYLPLGLITSYVLGWLFAVLLIVVIMSVCGPIELYLMRRGTFPWRFLKGVRAEVATSAFFLEAYNVAGYFLLGVGLGAVI